MPGAWGRSSGPEPSRIPASPEDSSWIPSGPADSGAFCAPDHTVSCALQACTSQHQAAPRGEILTSPQPSLLTWANHSQMGQTPSPDLSRGMFPVFWSPLLVRSPQHRSGKRGWTFGERTATGARDRECSWCPRAVSCLAVYLPPFPYSTCPDFLACVTVPLLQMTSPFLSTQIANLTSWMPSLNPQPLKVCASPPVSSPRVLFHSARQA